jgi:hypothetical protein
VLSSLLNRNAFTPLWKRGMYMPLYFAEISGNF